MNHGTAPPERLVLSRDLSDFLVEFSIALQSQGMYPQGHPSLDRSTAAVFDRLATLLQGRPTLSLGVAQRQLVIEGVATDPEHPLLHSLAQRLHGHHIGAVTFTRGVDLLEINGVLHTLAPEPEREEQPLGLGPPERLRAWDHVRLHPLTYEQLELVGEREGDETEEKDTRAEQLWLGLARAALAAEEAGTDLPSVEAATVAKAIDEHPRTVAYDQVIVGYLLQLSAELKAEGGTGAESVRRRVSTMVAALRPETLKRLVEMGGDFSQRKQFMLDATHGFTVDALIEILRAAAEASEQTVSHALIRLLSKIATHADQGDALVSSHADAEFRDQVRELVSGWELKDPHPRAYTGALERMARAAPTSEVAGEQVRAAEAQRIVQMSLEMDTASAPLWRAVTQMVERGDLALLLAILDGAPPGSRAAEAVWRHTATLEHVRQVLSGDPVDFASLDRLIERKGLAVAAPLLDALAESESRVTRRGVFDRLLRMGAEIGPLVVERLADPRWYVQRNLLALLNEFERWPKGFYPGPYARHSDPRVRREALKLLFRVPAERNRAVLDALKDADDRIVQSGLAAAQEACPDDAVPIVIRRAHDPKFPSELRVLAIRALRGVSSPAARDALLRLASRGRTLFGRPKLAPRSPEMLAALSGLAASWAEDSRASAVIGRAKKSRDREIRAATSPEASGP